MTLRTKIFASVIVPFMFFVTAIIWTTGSISSAYLARSFHTISMANLSHAESSIKSYFHEMEHSMQLMVRMVPLDKDRPRESRAIIESFLHRSPEILRISVIDTIGEEWLRVVKHAIDASDGDLESFFYKPAWQEPMLTYSTFIGNLQWDVEGALHPVIDLSVPIRNLDTGRTSGVVLNRLSLQHVYTILENNLPQNGKIVLMTEGDRGVLVEADSSLGVEWSEPDIIAAVSRNGTSEGITEVQVGSEMATVTYRHFTINDIPLTLLFAQPNATIYRLSETLKTTIVVVTIVGAFIFGTLTLFIIMRMTGPLMVLSDQMRELSSVYRPTSGGVDNTEADGDEIDQLAGSFALLKAQLSLYSTEIKSFNQTLERKVDEKAQELNHQAYHDALTGLPNRRLFSDRLEMAINTAQRHDEMLAVLFLDLDNFKNINDSVGHHTGDLFLREIAYRLVECCRKVDTVARLGGDEFVIILPEVKSAQYAAEVAQRVLDAVNEPVELDDNELTAGVSIGITLYPSDGDTVSALVRNADIAMYSAKEMGKNSYSMFTQAMNDSVLRRIALETSLRKALERDEFRVLYQPKVSIETGYITGTEALVRWQRTEEELVPPVEFIPLAEESDLICILGEWVLRTACAQTKQWHDAGYTSLSIAVNISARQFSSPIFVQTVSGILDQTGLPPECLNLEVTENVIIDAEQAIATMTLLSEMGIHISIDDFGTGYSSLSYLNKFPMNVLKIDKSFVDDIPRDKNIISIATSIISLAKNLNLKVVAEGVETVDQLDFMRKHGCHEIQGFLFSKPVPAEELGTYLKDAKRLD